MKYSEAKEMIKSGDLLVWTSKEWNSVGDIIEQIIQFFTCSEFCHTGIALHNETGLYVIEAVGAGVRLRRLDTRFPFYMLSIPGTKWTIEAEDFVLAQIGKPYSVLQAILAWFGVLNVGSDQEWECAELVKEILKRCSITLKGRAIPSENVSAAKALGAVLYLVEAD